MTSTADPFLPAPPSLVGRRGARRVDWPLVRHGAEMLLAMALGMAVLGTVRAMAGLAPGFAEHPGGSYALMATDMAVPMAAWMRIRGHAWTPTLEMSAAMYVPVVLVPLVWAGALSTMAFMVLAHTLMVVAMVAVLCRTIDGRTQELTCRPTPH
ncbi:hypothetical protein [Nocardioides sp. T2.26MG-1]|uniref:hypothetical protein n=1 Tax=Nocardioides sp. T2.26MG-1 TaxID=3041166 RepID=UPI002477C271|nr:hypothetical protein [Nocardioides sp. T2.26MG-1]CAI9417804.1 hypothetical protein HIDPHFAB_03111 [Nocardioides sp. T2.26MG-1]